MILFLSIIYIRKFLYLYNHFRLLFMAVKVVYVNNNCIAILHELSWIKKEIIERKKIKVASIELYMHLTYTIMFLLKVIIFYVYSFSLLPT